MDQPSTPPSSDDAKPASGGSLVRRGFWGLGDQAVVSGGNFLTNIILANAMPATEYGEYGLLWGVLLLLNGVHAAIVTYPLSVRGAGGSVEQIRRLAGGGVAITGCVGVVTVAMSLLACRALAVENVAGWMILAGLAWQLQETLRRALLAGFRMRAVIVGDAISYLGQAAGVAVLAYARQETLPNVFAVLAGTSLLAAAVQVVQVKLRLPRAGEFQEQVAHSWRIGRWSLLTNLIGIVNLQAIPWVVTAFHGPASAAMLQAVNNVLGLTNPIVLGLHGIVTPSVAHARVGGLRHAVGVGLKYALMGAVILFPIWLAIAVLPELALRLFYRQADSPYRELSLELRLMLAIYVIHYAGAMLGVILGGLERAGWAFGCALAAVGGTLLLTMPLSIRHGYTGALAGSVVSETLRLICSIVVVQYLIRSLRSRGAEPAGA